MSERLYPNASISLALGRALLTISALFELFIAAGLLIRDDTRTSSPRAILLVGALGVVLLLLAAGAARPVIRALAIALLALDIVLSLSYLGRDPVIVIGIAVDLSTITGLVIAPWSGRTGGLPAARAGGAQGQGRTPLPPSSAAGRYRARLEEWQRCRG